MIIKDASVQVDRTLTDFERQFMDKIHEFAKWQRQNGQTFPCVMCNTQTQSYGIYIPFNSHEWGAPKGKRRFIYYAICDHCANICEEDTVTVVLSTKVANVGETRNVND